MNEITFAYPEVLYLLLLIPVFILWFIFRDKDAYASMQMSTISGFVDNEKGFRYYFRYFLLFLRLALFALVIAMRGVRHK